ncbi:MAG: methyltransferase, FxLD system [Pseudonocardiaceae bacterium]|nr:methyltransferase, FxLD system [Pseudonocardiaceae bacterium]
MNIGTTDETSHADVLREALVDELHEQGEIRSDRVADAFRGVPRHLFAPEESLETAYRDNAVVTKRDEHGIAISSVSAPYIQARMLEQAQLAHAMRVLEIGSGGYNAALLAELVGKDGEVTTVDIDEDVIDRARSCLAAAGYSRVNVVLADAEGGAPDNAPYDRVIVTVGAWDIPPAWLRQLAEDGRLVVPLRMRGLTRSVVFEREGAHLVSRDYQLCGFVPMQGVGANRERLVLLHGEEVGLRVDGVQPVDAERLSDALFQPRVERWSGVEIGGMEPLDDLDLWLGAAVPNFCLLTAKDAAIERGVAPRGSRSGLPTSVAGGSFSYRVSRPVSPDKSRYEFGVCAHGPDAGSLADQIVDLIRTWDRDHRRGPGPRIEAHPAATPDAQLPEGRVIDKKYTRVVISWPPAASS